VLLWGKRVGATTADPALGCYAFEYEPAWKRRDIELAPLTMPISDRRQTFTFPALPKLTYFGLPSMLADALPDDFGNALIDAWMATKRRPLLQRKPTAEIAIVYAHLAQSSRAPMN
jgi:serine/threonine-protein kinase HipA